jgi:GTPase SAR1 family protein
VFKEKWYKKYLALGEETVCKILIANKIDLEGEREVMTEEGKKMAEDLDCEYREMCMLNADIKDIK